MITASVKSLNLEGYPALLTDRSTSSLLPGNEPDQYCRAYGYSDADQQWCYKLTEHDSSLVQRQCQYDGNDIWSLPRSKMEGDANLRHPVIDTLPKVTLYAEYYRAVRKVEGQLLVSRRVQC